MEVLRRCIDRNANCPEQKLNQILFYTTQISFQEKERESERRMTTQLFVSGHQIFSVDMMHVYINLFKPEASSIPMPYLEYALDSKTLGDEKAKHSCREVLDAPNRYINDIERIQNANLRYAIVIWNTKDSHCIVDGYHRLAKAHLARRKAINAVCFDTDMMKRFLLNSTGNYEAVKAMTIASIMQLFHKRFPDIPKPIKPKPVAATKRPPAKRQ
jgi:hypothetical protein